MRTRFYFFGISVLFALLCLSCDKNNPGHSRSKSEREELKQWKEQWVIASRSAETPDYPVVLWTKRNGSSEWTLLYPPFVSGFEYQEGFEYEIVVLAKEQDVETLPEDSPSIFYSLVEILRKEEMESVGIPFYKMIPS